MKKFSQSRIVKLIVRIIDIRQWLDWTRVKNATLYLENGFKRLFIPQKAIHFDSFEESMVRFKLSDENILAKQNALFRLSIIMVLSALLIFFYAMYQVFFGSIKAFLISIIIVLIALTLAFRYHFWYFQMKQRKLGYTFKEWYRQGLLGKKT